MCLKLKAKKQLKIGRQILSFILITQMFILLFTIRKRHMKQSISKVLKLFLTTLFSLLLKANQLTKNFYSKMKIKDLNLKSNLLRQTFASVLFLQKDTNLSFDITRQISFSLKILKREHKKKRKMKKLMILIILKSVFITLNSTRFKNRLML